MKIRLSRVPAASLRRGDEFIARWRSPYPGNSDFIILRVLNAQTVNMYDGRTREYIGYGGFPKGNVWKITGVKR